MSKKKKVNEGPLRWAKNKIVRKMAKSDGRVAKALNKTAFMQGAQAKAGRQQWGFKVNADWRAYLKSQGLKEPTWGDFRDFVHAQYATDFTEEMFKLVLKAVGHETELNQAQAERDEAEAQAQELADRKRAAKARIKAAKRAAKHFESHEHKSFTQLFEDEFEDRERAMRDQEQAMDHEERKFSLDQRHEKLKKAQDRRNMETSQYWSKPIPNKKALEKAIEVTITKLLKDPNIRFASMKFDPRTPEFGALLDKLRTKTNYGYNQMQSQPPSEAPMTTAGDLRQTQRQTQQQARPQQPLNRATLNKALTELGVTEQQMDQIRRVVLGVGLKQAPEAIEKELGKLGDNVANKMLAAVLHVLGPQ